VKTPPKVADPGRPTAGERLFARWYPWLDRRAEAAGVGALREAALRGVRGRTLEIGAGHGANLPHYPAAAAPLVLTDPSEPMLELLRRAARSRELSIVCAGAESLPVPDGSFDAVVATFVLCSVEDQPAALAEIARVLAPGGRLHFLEHVRAADGTWLARAQDAFEAPHRVIGGRCRPNRRTEAAIRGTPGLAIAELQAGELPMRLSFVRPYILGTAVRGEATAQDRSTSSGA